MSIANYRILFGVYSISILAVSSIPGESFPDIGLYTLDKVFHFIEYSILGYFTVKCFRKPTWSWIPLILIYGMLFAGFDEFWQSFIPGRLSSQFDMLADISGIVFGSVLTVWISMEND